MESIGMYVDKLHHQQEEAYLNGNQLELDAVNAELDKLITDEVLEEMKGDK